MACGCQGTSIQSAADRQAARARSRDERMAKAQARAERVQARQSTGSYYWNGPKGKDGS